MSHSSITIQPERLAETISAALEDYNQKKTDELKKSIRDTAKICKLEIQSASPVLTGSYRKGWCVKIAYESASDIRAIVRNKTDYQLTHLLEYGHAGRDGTNVGSAPAYPHIKKAEQNATADLEKNVKLIFGGA